MVEKKKIKINESEYEIKANALTWITYKEKFQRDWFEDCAAIVGLSINFESLIEPGKEVQKEVAVSAISSLGNFFEPLIKMTWMMIYTANKDCLSFEEFASSITDISPDDEWISEVLVLIAQGFR